MTLTHTASTPSAIATDATAARRSGSAAWIGFAATLAIACASFVYLEVEAITAAPSIQDTRQACLHAPALFK